jgi:hypothetical protein
MNDKELADKLVELGIGTKFDFPARGWMYGLDGIHGTDDEQQYPSSFVRDWRVAGALMEKWGNGLEYVLIVDVWEIQWWQNETDQYLRNESLPRAIIEACVEALDSKELT